MTELWEVGSEFHWSHNYLVARDESPNITFPQGILFSRARGALTALIRMRGSKGNPARLHLPSYFCMDIAEYLATVCEIRWYRHFPGQPADFDTLSPTPGDMVLALNMFGAETGVDWQHWSEHAQVCLIEDHSHDPLSAWAVSSRADYAFASLRKTLPIPDGALLWSPCNHSLPPTGPGYAVGANDKLSAMILKAAYIDGTAIVKDVFRSLQLKGEIKLDADCGAPAHEFTRAVLGNLDILGLRDQRAKNIQLFRNLLAQDPISGVDQVYLEIPKGCVLFNPILCFTSRIQRDSIRSGLAESGIFAPVHWSQELPGFTSGDPETIALASRLLTIPLDFRCTQEDVLRVLATLRRLAEAKVSQ